MNVKLEQIYPYKIAYMRRVGEYNAENISLMEQLKQWASVNNLLDDDTVILGIAQDDPHVVQPWKCRYDVCLVLQNVYQFNDEEIRVGTIAGGKYAVFEIEHTTSAIQKAWLDIFEEIAKLSYKVDPTRPIIERYSSKMLKNHLCEICMPID